MFLGRTPSLQAREPFYETHDVGVLGLADDECWAAFGPPDYRQVTHQTISLGSAGLRVFVNTELKAATDRLKRVLIQSEPEFREALQLLHLTPFPLIQPKQSLQPFELVLEERTQLRPKVYKYTRKMRLHSSMLVEATGDVVWRAFAQTVDRLPLPYLRIERIVPAARLLELSKRDPREAVQCVVEILRTNHAVVNLLNES
jgi:hypothetical protein